MAEVATTITDFTSTGRTGRRNALPDILDVAAQGSGEDLVERLDSLTIGAKTDTASGSSDSQTEGTSSKTEHSDKSQNEGS